MKIFYLIGDSIQSSLSPYIHNWAYKFLGINAKYENCFWYHNIKDIHLLDIAIIATSSSTRFILVLVILLFTSDSY